MKNNLFLKDDGLTIDEEISYLESIIESQYCSMLSESDEIDTLDEYIFEE